MLYSIIGYDYLLNLPTNKGGGTHAVIRFPSGSVVLLCPVELKDSNFSKLHI